MPSTEHGTQIRLAHLLLNGGNENTMTAALLPTINELLPSRIQAVFDVSQDRLRPDVTLRTSDGGLVGYIEVKRPETLADAFALSPDGTYQIERYRREGASILLTDGVRYYNVSDRAVWNPSMFGALLSHPFAEFSDPARDAQSEQSLRGLLAISTLTRPRYSLAAAPLAMGAMVSRINNSHTESLEAAWSAARAYLGLTSEGRELGGGEVGEIVAFTLLAIAANLPTLDNAEFVDAATREWNDSVIWRVHELPPALRGCLRDFREADSESRGTLLGSGGWVIIRSIAASLLDHEQQLSWERLSSLWDDYLGIAGQRSTLGSWQTPPAVAKYQTAQVSAALRSLGYGGFSDPHVTAIDPCCGTGVYLQEVAAAVRHEVGSAAGLSRTDTSPARLLGCDISPAAVAAAHIRLSAQGVRPSLYMADTLRASPSRGSNAAATHVAVAMFDADDTSFSSALANAVRRDDTEMRRWASRSADRDPILAIIGNPPYQRSGINPADYADRAWYDEYFDLWREGSGGRGSLQDPFVAFAAWAFGIARLGHPSFADAPPRGVVSFIANRSWVAGHTFGPFRAWLRSNSSSVIISDFGPGSRGNVGDRWSEQPFAIEAGTAIFTVTFGTPAEGPAEISYTPVAWVDGDVEIAGDNVTPQDDRDWTGKASSRALIEESRKINGIKTGSDSEWIRTTGDRDFGTRHAFRAFDNRYSPTTPPVKTRRGAPVLPGQARPSADWRRQKLWEPFRDRWDEGGWYVIGQASSAKPGPALHATRFLPDYHAFKGSEGGNILPITPSTPIPEAYTETARELGVSGMDFWYMILAAANHKDYWTEGTALARQIADNRVEPPLPTSSAGAQRLVELGRELVKLWSLDDVTPVDFHGRPGAWHFDLHNVVADLQVNGRKVLQEWRRARPGDWSNATATEYARSVSALAQVKADSGLVAIALNRDERTQPVQH